MQKSYRKIKQNMNAVFDKTCSQDNIYPILHVDEMWYKVGLIWELHMEQSSFKVL